MHPRSALRASVRAALEATPELGGATYYAAWSMPTDEAALPAVTCVMPRERIEEVSAGGQTDRNTDLGVVMKFASGDSIENEADDYSASIETVVMAALEAFRPELYEWATKEVHFKFEGGAQMRIATIEVGFEAVRRAVSGQQ